MISPAPTLVFDLGGVLVRHDNDLLYDRLAARCVDPVAARERIIVALDEPDIGTGRLGIDRLHTRLVQELSFADPYDAFLAIWSSHFSEEPGMEALVRDLATRHRTIIFSNTNAPHIEHIEANFPVYRCAHAAYLSYELGLVKPDAGAFQRVLELESRRARDCIFIDDRPENTAAAEALGIETVTFTSREALLAALARHGVSVEI